MAVNPSIAEATDQAIQRAGAIVRAGGLVAFPTETVYGLGAHALDVEAVAKVFETKGRPRFDPLIVHLAQPESAQQLAADWPLAAQRLAEAFWPGPLTLVVRKKPATVSDLVTSGLETVGVRVPSHPVARALIEAAGVPVAAPSANRFGAISPTAAVHVASEFAGRGDVVELVLDGGPCETGVESTVVSVVGLRPMILRAGGITLEAIREVVGEVEMATARSEVASPGMLERHYAPRTPLRLVTDGKWPSAEGRRMGIVCFQSLPGSYDGAAGDRQQTVVEILSPKGDLREAAANLFAAMRRLDAAGVDLIVAEPVPQMGLGVAINDRLRRAARGREAHTG